jgi:hypothetical protein
MTRDALVGAYPLRKTGAHFSGICAGSVVSLVSFPSFEATIEVFMQALAPRFIDAAEATRLGVQSGWYGSKASGTFVTGPHETEKECEQTLAAQKK